MDAGHEPGSLKNISTNGTAEQDSCSSLPSYFTFLMLTDVVTAVMGQPVLARLLWTTLTSKKSKDILNLNLALFHSIQYLMSNMHFFFLLANVHAQKKLLRFLYVFVQVGGPMNLTFICMERYIAVIHPTYFPLLKKYRCREVCVASVWFCALPTAILTLPNDTILSDIAEMNLGNISYFLMMTMTVLMMYSSISAARALQHSPVRKDVQHPAKKRAFITIVVVSNTALFCYIPVTLMQRLEYADPDKYTCITTPLSIVLLSAASVVHPAFYLSTQGKLCICCRRQRKPK